MGRRSRFAKEVRERAVRLVLEQQGENPSQWPAIGSVASKIGCTPETLRKWVRQAECDHGKRTGLTVADESAPRQIEEPGQASTRAGRVVQSKMDYGVLVR